MTFPAKDGTQIAGYLQSDSSPIIGNYHGVAPWTAATTLDSQAAANGDVQAALLAAIDAVQTGSIGASSGLGWGFWFWIVFALVCAVFGGTSMFWGGWLIRKMTGTAAVKGGLPGDAVIETIADTGVTVSMADVGPDAPEYKFGLRVTPAGGGATYAAEVKALVPRLFIPMVVPGAQVGVMIDPKNPQKMSLDFSRMGGSASETGAAAGYAGAAAGAGSDAAAAAGSFGPGGMEFQFDANGRPMAGEVSALVGAVRGGTLPTINSPAERLLATGTHGTAVITSAQPLGKTVRDIDPNADPSRLDDPMWVFTVEVTVAGENPFPAVFGHRVPLAKVASIAPGVTLSIAVDMSDRHNEVAIDWDKSPIGA